MFKRVQRDLGCPTTRGNSVKLRREVFSARSKNDFAAQVSVRHNFFSNRVTPVWNALPDSVVLAPGLNCFKNRLDEFISRNGLLQFSV